MLESLSIDIVKRSDFHYHLYQGHRVEVIKSCVDFRYMITKYILLCETCTIRLKHSQCVAIEIILPVKRLPNP